MKIAPSLLSADFAILGHQLKELTDAGADRIHIDIMDGHFVPNLTMGAQLVKAIRSYSNLPFDVHLMILPVDLFIQQFAEAGADSIIIHYEATAHHTKLLQYIKSFNKKAGIAINPSTSEQVLEYLLPYLDIIVVMTVNPGFSGQCFLSEQLVKIKSISQRIKSSRYNIELQVDGGVNDLVAKQLQGLGVDVLVAGSFIFNKSSYRQQLNKLR